MGNVSVSLSQMFQWLKSIKTRNVFKILNPFVKVWEIKLCKTYENHVAIAKENKQPNS